MLDHLDMLDQGFGPPYGCWCEACRAEFQREHGHAMPPGATWDAAWDRMLEFRYRTGARFMQALRGHIRTLDPRATVDFNYHGNPPFSFETGQRPVQHAGLGDFITGETGVWGFGALTGRFTWSSPFHRSAPTCPGFWLIAMTEQDSALAARVSSCKQRGDAHPRPGGSGLSATSGLCFWK